MSIFSLDDAPSKRTLEIVEPVVPFGVPRLAIDSPGEDRQSIPITSKDLRDAATALEAWELDHSDQE